MTPDSHAEIRRALAGARQLCLFGAGVLLNDCYDQLVSMLGREPDFLCDNSPEKWGQSCRGMRCISPAQLAGLGEGTVVLITVRKYEEIYRQLRGLGLKEIFVSCYDSGYYGVRTVQRLEELDLAPSKEPLPPVDLQGKWTLVTGASRGVGRQIALALAKLGSNLVVHGRALSHLEDLVDSCSGHGVRVEAVAAELSDLGEVEAMLRQLDRVAPRIDVVFNNAAISPPCYAGFWKQPGEIYRDCFAVNSIAPALICQRLIPAMIERGFGRVININTNLQKRPEEIAYACSKAALDKFVHDLAPTLEQTGVTLTLVDPGWVRTDAGGPNAPNAVESVVPGVLLGALLDCSFNGRRFSAQDYCGLSLETAIDRAMARFELSGAGKWI